MTAMRNAMPPISTSSRRPGPRGNQAGFTLLELLVVLVILGLLAGLAAPRVMEQLGGAKSKAAKLQVKNLSTALDMIRLDIGRYPTQQEGLDALVKPISNLSTWHGPYIDKTASLTDPWGNPYHYRQPGQHGPYDLYSLGADNAEGGEGENQDAVNW